MTPLPLIGRTFLGTSADGEAEGEREKERKRKMTGGRSREKESLLASCGIYSNVALLLLWRIDLQTLFFPLFFSFLLRKTEFRLFLRSTERKRGEGELKGVKKEDVLLLSPYLRGTCSFLFFFFPPLCELRNATPFPLILLHLIFFFFIKQLRVKVKK